MDGGKTTLSGLEMLLLALFFASILIAIWGFNAVRKEGEKVAPLHFREEAIFRVWLGQFIWSASASRRVRQQYVITTGCFILGFACLTAFIWGRYDYRFAIIPTLMLVVVTSTFGWSCLRHWGDIRPEG
jgi:hypothetical protein